MEKKNFHAPAQCPVCGERMLVTKLRCSHCGTELSGEFAPCRFCRLEEKHLQFVETFLRCRGSIKEVERALGVSYPTVKNMLDAALTALGLDEKPELGKGGARGNPPAALRWGDRRGYRHRGAASTERGEVT